MTIDEIERVREEVAADKRWTAGWFAAWQSQGLSARQFGGYDEWLARHDRCRIAETELAHRVLEEGVTA